MLSCLFNTALWSPWLSCVWCFVVLSLSSVVSWVGCGTWSYWYLIFASLLTLKTQPELRIEESTTTWQPSGFFFTRPFQCATSFVDPFCYLRLSFYTVSSEPWSLMITCWKKGSPFGSLVCDVSLCLGYFPIWRFASSVVLDCIDSWSLPSLLLVFSGIFLFTFMDMWYVGKMTMGKFDSLIKVICDTCLLSSKSVTIGPPIQALLIIQYIIFHFSVRRILATYHLPVCKLTIVISYLMYDDYHTLIMCMYFVSNLWVG